MQRREGIAETRSTIARLRSATDTADKRPAIGLVPTMGNLHEGHLKLVAACLKQCQHAVVSIYVNPLQFGPNEDFGSYPRTLDADLEKLQDAGASLVFIPQDAELYPEGRDNQTRVHVPGISDILCGASRPGHFDGVATIVLKLFNIVQPDRAFFGRKDFQQLQVLRTMARQLNLPIELVGVPTQRADDGLALSSRNQYLTPAERERAPALYATLQALGERLQAGERDFQGLVSKGRQLLEQAGMRPDYVEIRNPETLQPPAEADQAFVLLCAAYLGKARLIDNLVVGTPETS